MFIFVFIRCNKSTAASFSRSRHGHVNISVSDDVTRHHLLQDFRTVNRIKGRGRDRVDCSIISSSGKGFLAFICSTYRNASTWSVCVDATVCSTAAFNWCPGPTRFSL